MTQIYAYLTFNGNCREAMTFYKESLGGELTLNCSSEEEINRYFSSLSSGGQIIHPLRTEFWGAIFGVLTDKFGIRWMLNYDKNLKNQNLKYLTKTIPEK